MKLTWTPLPTAREDFDDSVLGLYLGRHASSVYAQGQVRHLLPDACLRVPAGVLIVVLRGHLLGNSGWWGPGNHLLDGADMVRAGEWGARVWTLPPSRRAEQQVLLSALLAAEAAEQAASAVFRLPPAEDPCNHGHPLIRRTASRLACGTPEADAQSVFHFVQRMPYRFGGWQERASDTLLRGVGVCTAKAHLQVALWRALGLEAGFIEIELSMRVLSLLMPPRWIPLMRSRVKHYCAAVRLDDRWHVADASFSDEAIRLFIEADPALAPHGLAQLGLGRPFHPVAGIQGLDPFDVEVMPEIQTAMRKRSRFEAHHFEALNTRLDRAHGLHRLWMQRVQPLSWPAMPQDASRLPSAGAAPE
jgi:Transglutaminase-like superfamily